VGGVGGEKFMTTVLKIEGEGKMHQEKEKVNRGGQPYPRQKQSRQGSRGKITIGNPITTTHCSLTWANSGKKRKDVL